MSTAHVTRIEGPLDLQDALARRAPIEQAKGILMAVHRITADEAFALLVERSQRANRKVHDIALEFVHEMAELPDRQVDPARCVFNVRGLSNVAVRTTSSPVVPYALPWLPETSSMHTTGSTVQKRARIARAQRTTVARSYDIT